MKEKEIPFTEVKHISINQHGPCGLGQGMKTGFSARFPPLGGGKLLETQ